VSGEESEPDGWTQVAETRQRYEAELIRLRLESAGIETHLIDQSYNQEPMPDVRSLALVRVLTPADRADEARRVLATPVDLPEDADEAPGGEAPDSD
jgi:hypothetical protein